MFIDSIIIGIVGSLLLGGSFKGFVNIKLKHPWLITVSFLIQFGSIYFFKDHLLAAVILSNIGLLLFCLVNYKNSGFTYMVIGIVLNLIVMLANRGRMPVDAEAAKILSPEDFPALLAGEYGKHIAISDHSHLNILGDIIFLQSPYPRPIIISIGDILLSIGVILFMYKVMVKNKKKSEEVAVNGA
ncbi:hypothetical protein CVD28_26655 [Bacillus sp. M6-12]|uniref:DUF5317 domain-containing protein n=1 Tax=Bacillus sp. M6-12 TaxID=2054166 RepID=UPI000C755C84|nr:DUF5317 domain-containing protein [Bacillus sp. M6-12]PLS14758.1 hypothetical protein CVD28_26655 [Bacillus sp. M6-12]